MKPLLTIFRKIWAAAPGAMTRGAVLTVVVLVAGASLLGLSGWFITAAGAAGLTAGALDFNVFGPSAGVRGLALGRTAARYGERLLTHDATLRALAALRIDLMRRQTRAGLDTLLRLRGATALNRITADVDALDGVALRLVLPLAAGLITHVLAFFLLAWLVDETVALWVALGYFVGGAVILTATARAGLQPSIRAERGAQALRRAVIDMGRARTELVVFGRMEAQRGTVLAADAETRGALDALDRAERRAGLALSSVATLLAGGALAIGGALVSRGALDPASAALGFFVALGLGEMLFGLRRGMAELGRMRDAAGRVLDDETAPGAVEEVVAEPSAPTSALTSAPTMALTPADGTALLEISGLTYRRPGAGRPVLDALSLSVAAGETVAVSGPSGSGKSTLLFLCAGLLAPESGMIALAGTPLPDLGERTLRAQLTLVPQRAALVAGTIRENLALACDDLTDAEAEAALAAVALSHVIAAKGGLDATLGEGGAGLSGGETRRLVLARALLRRPRVLLLDEPTEGLDPETARAVLDGIRAWLPQAAILTASHRAAELGWAGRVVPIA
ncbi:amino acid ABC transporter ATP-binding/permease protein [Acidimangrovimonas sediminis]|uniref:amino acid ABC transporter ATP-binding/permease protein n=1 Tax=Acidimangrovimonas sediminis TaxID=2056283 RepID=UPI000C7FFA0E|nr:ATP-binding cassette domain-containing protein [Acidimangrovimonas sediminis]